jgi:oligopeptide/dipeptide ABC transporter ATP-binding protein
VSAQNTAQVLLSVRNLAQEFALRKHGSAQGGVLRAVRDVSFDISKGESLGLVGESGSGKTTLARAILQVPRPTFGRVLFRGEDITQMRGRQLLESRRFMQIVFQDPVSSLNPTWRVLDIVEEPLLGYRIGNRRERQRKVAEALELVGLSAATHGRRRPRELSGGQCQRVSIARALVLDPELIVCDEALSALDVLIQAQISNLFDELRERLGLAYLFISHDLPLVRKISDRIAVLYLGWLCEIGPAGALYERPLHPYTARLIASIPGNDPAFGIEDGSDEELRRDVPSPLQPPSGCRYHTCCLRAQERCRREEPVLRPASDDHFVACHYPAGG